MNRDLSISNDEQQKKDHFEYFIFKIKHKINAIFDNK